MKKSPGKGGTDIISERPKLVVTIDTEEDNWGEYAGSGAALTNIEMIPRLQRMFDDFNVRPTYLVTYPVATNERAVSLLKAIRDGSRCEIGAHLHPWNTPPVQEGSSADAYMLCNLPPNLQEKKMRALARRHKNKFRRYAVIIQSRQMGVR